MNFSVMDIVIFVVFSILGFMYGDTILLYLKNKWKK
jgi:hypothetical protein